MKKAVYQKFRRAKSRYGFPYPPVYREYGVNFRNYGFYVQTCAEEG